MSLDVKNKPNPKEINNMSIFSTFKNQEVKIEAVKDVIGGGNTFGILETGTYSVVIKNAYVDESKGGAMSVNFEFKTDTGNILRSTQWATSGKAKGQKNFYTDKNGNNHLLPGYVAVDDICQLAAELPLSEIEPEEKVVQIYDFDLGKPTGKPRMVLTELLGKKIILAVEKQVVDKNVKNDSGDYVPSGDTREVNEVVKSFCADDQVTVVEKAAGLTEADFLTRWNTKNKDKVINKAKGAKAATGTAPVAGTPAPADTAATSTKSLFG